MRSVIQRVNYAKVTVEQEEISSIKKGIVVFLGINENDTAQDLDWLVKKISGLRIFSDEQGKMNLALKEINGEIMVISQFTLFASTKKGNRPSFLQAAKQEKALLFYNLFIEEIGKTNNIKIACGVFGADMKIALENDGPVTIIIDSQNLE